MSLNTIKVTGKIQIFENGKLVLEKNNLVVNSGTELICDMLKDKSPDALGWIAVGTDNTTVSASDAALFSELDRKAATNVTAGVSTFIIETAFDLSEALGTWREAGIFNAASLGIMFNRININYIKGASNVTVRFTITFTTS